MFYKLSGRETYKHMCDDKKPTAHLPQGIYRHDIKNYILIFNDITFKHEDITVKCCPFCGVNLDSDTFSDIQVID